MSLLARCAGHMSQFCLKCSAGCTCRCRDGSTRAHAYSHACMAAGFLVYRSYYAQMPLCMHTFVSFMHTFMTFMHTFMHFSASRSMLSYFKAIPWISFSPDLFLCVDFLDVHQSFVGACLHAFLLRRLLCFEALRVS